MIRIIDLIEVYNIEKSENTRNKKLFAYSFKQKKLKTLCNLAIFSKKKI